jgi:hypothetical protein
MRRRAVAILALAMLLSSCVGSPLVRPTPAGNWRVTTDPSAVVGRPLRIIFRFTDDMVRPETESFAFSVTCTTCPDPRPVVTGIATKDATANERLYSSTAVVFPSAGSWWTSPFIGPIEVR